MSDDPDRPRRDSAEEGEPDAFDSLDDEGAAIDDPFAELGEGIGADGSDAGGDPDARDHSVDDSARSSPETTPDADRDDPFDAIGRADADRADPFADASGEWDDEMADLDDAFEQMDVDGPAAEDVWESLGADAGTDAFDADAGLGGAASVPGGGDTEHVVSKRTYCQQCPHFTRPPEAACTHEGTTIVEAVGFDEFRVRNCPMISEEDPTFDADH